MRARVFIAGLGQVGIELVRQIENSANQRKESFDVRLEIAGVATSQNSLVTEQRGLGIPAARLRSALASSAPGSASHLADAARMSTEEIRVFVDCTASNSTGLLFEALQDAGVHVVSANKKPFAGSQQLYDAIKRQAPGRGRVRHETTVGAALPVFSTLETLRRAGDPVHRIEATLSSTVTFLLSRVAMRVPLSDAVREARDLGYMEPDSCDDLCGIDAARKAIILARETFGPIDETSVQPESLAPGIKFTTFDGLVAELRESDALLSDRVARAFQRERSLAYVASVTAENAEIGLREIEATSPFAKLRATEGAFAFFTERHREAPLVIKGQMAGVSLAASGVLADIVRVATP